MFCISPSLLILGKMYMWIKLVVKLKLQLIQHQDFVYAPAALRGCTPDTAVL